MNFKNLKNSSFEELRYNFLSGHYDQDWDEHHDAMNELHNKLPAIEELIPLLTSGNRNCQYTAAFIAAQEGDNARSIFPHLFALLESPWEDVRDEICDCFLNCTSDASHYISLLAHLEDSSESIRLRVITIICGINSDVIRGIYEKLNTTEPSNTLREAFELLYKQNSEGLVMKCIVERISKGSKLEKVFAYVSTYREFGESEQLLEIANLTNEVDIKKHYEVYFCDDEKE